MLELREAVNLVLEKARGARAIGASLDARVTLAVSDPSLRAQLAKLNAAANGVDELRYLFIVSQVCGARGGLGGVGKERRACGREGWEGVGGEGVGRWWVALGAPPPRPGSTPGSATAQRCHRSCT